MRLAIRHVTRYQFAQPVAHGLQRLRLKPKSTHGQSVLAWTTDLEGASPEAEYEDHHGNGVTLVSVHPQATAVTVSCSGIVDTADNAGIVGPHAGHMPLWCFLRATELTRPGARVRALTSGLAIEPATALDTLHDLSRRVLEAVRYEVGSTAVDTVAEQALSEGRGVCQDHAHIFIAAARVLGCPARYVSGYLMMDDRVEQDAGHAWAEAHIAGLGWVGFDVSNGISPDPRYVRVATGSDYREAAPITGLSVGAGETALEVRLAVEQQTIEQ